MSLIAFVRNYEDLSTERGYQFKFFCDKCGNGFMTRFQPSVLGTAGSLLRAAGDLFGGWVGSAGNSAYEVQRAVGGKAHDDALQTATEEGKQHFHQCTRCGQWVCPEVCWNASAGLCESCAPNYREELAAAHAQAKVDAARNQLHERAQAMDYTSGVDMRAGAYIQAPPIAPTADGYAPSPNRATAAPACASCGVAIGSAKFCPQCGTPVRPVCIVCRACGHELQPSAKFCAECGATSS